MQTDENNPAAKFITNLITETFNRINHGEVNEAKDRRQLEHLLQEARKHQFAIAEAMALKVLAGLDIVVGQQERAHKLLWEAFAIYEKRNDIPGMMGILNNKAQYFHEVGEYEQALTIFNRGEKLSDATEPCNRPLGFLQIGKFKTLVDLARYDDASLYFEDYVHPTTTEVMHKNPQVYAYLMVYGHQAQAAIALHHQQYSEARQNLNLALEFANGIQLSFEKVDIYLRYLYLKEQAPTLELIKQDPWQLITALVRESPVIVRIAWVFLRHARFLGAHGQAEIARTCAECARDIFWQKDIPAYVAVAETVLD
ncbi:MAG TPA: hypothetical protein VHO69_16465, partial [Phototrophicaceae bacterium]|nr:hypothetical protein [Phototrophicaceae bacterium]